MLEYYRIDLPERIDVNETMVLHKRDNCRYWYFLETNFGFQPQV